uniref:Zinc finger CCCH domain-containing protein 18 isoform X1 n=1 Tax=Cymbidium ensifolium TaxID=78740 RepID=A0A5J6N9X6_CYMEN|nr:zinc finger CCCH domain-containing protein 18 isoform X1 [Cymbidium ensifolium]
MADHSAGDDETAVEQQLELHLEEQRESLSTVKEALASDPANPELIAVLEELQVAIKDAEDGLLHLKRSRLLKKADEIFAQDFEPSEEDVEVESLDSKHILLETSESEIYSPGSKCRFRHSDGRWYNGHIVALDGSSNAARISFLTPTSESMLICKFFLQQRCRFGSNCRMSHGFSIPFSSLKPYIPTRWCESLVGSAIWATSERHLNIWRRAELESWDDKLCLGQVIFQDDGSSAKLGSEALSISEFADASSDDNDDDQGSLGTSSSSSSDDDDIQNGSVHQGLGFLKSSASLRGIQTEIAVFAKWEHHTRGIASKLMANMGYRKGMGLGASSQGTLDPISVRVLPSRQSLDLALASNGDEENSLGRGKKRSRGGRRKQEKKLAEAERVAKAEEEEGTDVFSFINNQLTGSGLNAASSIRGSKLKRGPGDLEVKAKVEDRRSLVAYEDEMKELRIRVEKLEEMVNRNRKDKAVFEAASRKLIETHKALADAEAAHVSASNAVMSKEKEKRWLKF